MLQLPTRLALAAACAATLLCSGAAAHAGDDGFVIDVTQPKRSKYPLAIPLATTGDQATARTVQSVASFDLSIAGWFKVVSPKAFLANLEREGLSIEPESWKNIGAFGVMKYRTVVSGKRMQIDFKLYEVEKGDTPVLEKSYRGDVDDVRKLTHMWCNEVVEHLTGESGFFGSKFAFVTKGKKRTKKIMVMDFDGADRYSLFRRRSIHILPAWSPGGDKLLFTSYVRKNPDLYEVVLGSRRPRRISHRRGMNTNGDYSPDGSKIALTLSRDGNAEIYVISARSGKILKRLTRNRHIDTSPVWSPSGKEIAFISDRQGGPQIFVMNADGSNQRRVSMNGSYNTTPTWSPRKDERRLAYTTRGDEGNFDIVTLDLDSGDMVRITQNEGTNEEPSFAPNGRAIAFSSSRPGGQGIYIANVDGTGDAVRVYRGNVTSIDWGPTPAQ